jgi:hypothetical protein
MGVHALDLMQLRTGLAGVHVLPLSHHRLAGRAFCLMACYGENCGLSAGVQTAQGVQHRVLLRTACVPAFDMPHTLGAKVTTPLRPIVGPDLLSILVEERAHLLIGHQAHASRKALQLCCVHTCPSLARLAGSPATPLWLNCGAMGYSLLFAAFRCFLRWAIADKNVVWSFSLSTSIPGYCGPLSVNRIAPRC